LRRGLKDDRIDLAARLDLAGKSKAPGNNPAFTDLIGTQHVRRFVGILKWRHIDGQKGDRA
jgi:hypothetical protein